MKLNPLNDGTDSKQCEGGVASGPVRKSKRGVALVPVRGSDRGMASVPD